MKTFAVNTEEGPVGEAAEFSDGQVVVRWLGADTVSRFQSMDMLRSTLTTFEFGPIPTEPMAQRLQRARSEAGLSLRGLAKETGVSFSTVARIEAGHNYIANPALEEWLESR